jgi:hypothetical protein
MVVPARSGTIASFVRTSEILILISWRHAFLPNYLLCVFCQLLLSHELCNGSMSYLFFGLITWHIVLPHHKDFVIIIGVGP